MVALEDQHAYALLEVRDSEEAVLDGVKGVTDSLLVAHELH